jgi:hypothetical protein
MPQKTLYMVKIGPGFQKVGGKTVPQGMDCGVFLDPGLIKDLSKNLLDRRYGKRSFGGLSGKQPVLGPIRSPVVT